MKLFDMYKVIQFKILMKLVYIRLESQWEMIDMQIPLFLT